MPTFEEFAATEGMQLLAYDDHPDWLDAVAEFYANMTPFIGNCLRSGEPMILDIHLVDRPGLNAFAASFDDADVICLYRDTVRLIRATARGLVSQGLLLPHIGAENNIVKSRHFSGPPRQVLTNEIDLCDDPLEDIERDRLALHITRLAAHFIIQHEFAHISNGHTSWIGSQRKLALIIEMDDGHLESTKGMERETLEWDADSTAITHVLKIALNPEMFTIDGRTAWKIPNRNSIGDVGDAVTCVVAAFFLCGAYFASVESSLWWDLEPRSHPHPAIRMASIISAITLNISFRSGTTEKEADAHLANASSIIPSWLSLFRGHLPQKDHVPGFLDFCDNRLKQYDTVWQRLEPELRKFKRGGTLAPLVRTRHPAFPNNDVIG
ncbi:hypothetical protein [Sphingomonas bisphenolicum]|uniref:hypothetical protein n=1 Tax=Sphingomonas bisphenolicum TaxID=296544 RepID=UPI0021C45F0E|nr:hypothetical protein [Sphingomonas bisphenolicum]